MGVMTADARYLCDSSASCFINFQTAAQARPRDGGAENAGVEYAGIDKVWNTVPQDLRRAFIGNCLSDKA